MRLTLRDREVIDFVEYFGVTEGDILRQRFYPSERVCQRRLKILTENKYLKRVRAVATSYYVYMGRSAKLPEFLEHACLITRLVPYLEDNGNTILSWKREFTLSSAIKCDAMLTYKTDKGEYKIACVECERSNNPLNIKLSKYENYAQARQYLDNGFPVMPEVIVITRKMFNNLNNTLVKYRILHPDFYLLDQSPTTSNKKVVRPYSEIFK